MLESIRRAFFLALVLGPSAFALSSAPQPPPSQGERNGFTITRGILKSFYPDLFGKGWYFNVSTGHPVDNDPWGAFSGFRFNITRFGPGVSFNPTYDARTGKMAPEPENTIFLQGRTWVGPDKQIISFVASGELAHSRQNQEIRKLVQSHPEWSEEQAIHALKEAGARYGPAEKARFTQSLDLERAQDSLGRLRIVSVEFVPLQQERVGSFSSGALQWVVHAEGETADKTRITYILWFEPFEGKLVHIYRKGAPVG